MKKKRMKSVTPRPVPRCELLALGKSVARADIDIWEFIKVWDWTSLLTDDEGKPNKQLLLDRLAQLHIHFSDSEIPSNEKSYVCVVRFAAPPSARKGEEKS